jgi:CheY-like chemotaxis protein
MADGTPRTDPRVLLLEDELLLAMDIEAILGDGGILTMTVSRVADGLAAVEGHEIEAALLDINVAGESSVPLAVALKRRGIPFMFLTGYLAPQTVLPPELTDVGFLAKPIDPIVLVDAVRSLTASSI